MSTPLPATRMSKRRYRPLFCGFLLSIVGVSNAAEYHVSPSGNDDDAGTRQAPWRTIAKANAELRPGDTVIIGQGEYAEAINPERSGQAGSPITYKVEPGSKAVISDPLPIDGKRTAISLSNVSHIVVDGMQVDGKRLSGGAKDSTVDSFIRFNNADFCIIKNGRFQFANGGAGIHVSGGSDYNKFLNNSFDAVGTNHIPDGYPGAGEDSGDIMVIKNGSYNLVEGNSFSRGGHNTLDVIGSYNVIRGNDFDGAWTGTESPGSRAGGTLNGNTKFDVPEPRGFNLFEFNTVRNAGPSGDNPDNPGMKVEGQNQIVRGNYFFDNGSVAVSGATRTGSIERTAHNRIYHNTFFNNESLLAYRDFGNRLPFSDNVWKNNLIVQHRDKTQINIGVDSAAEINPDAKNDLNETVIAGNLFDESRSGSVEFKVRFDGQFVTGSIDWYEQQYPDNFFANVTGSIQFEDVDSRRPDGFRIRQGSAAIDGGIPLTRARVAGSGTILQVDDARFFYDGFGIPGESGDTIVIGNSEPVRIVSVDYDRDEIVIERSRSWSDDAAVGLEYSGNGPDIGAHEVDALRSGSGQPAPEIPPRTTAPPLPPRLLTIN